MKQPPRKYTKKEAKRHREAVLCWLVWTINTILIISIVQKLNISRNGTEEASTETVSSSQVTTYMVYENPDIPLTYATSKASPKPLTEREQINKYITDVCSLYPNVDPTLIMSIIEQESRYKPNVENGKCIGLMQVSSYWNAPRIKKLGVTDLHDPHDNILVGVDYISELLTKHKDTSLVLMLYNMSWDSAFEMHAKGLTSNYAKSVLTRQTEIQKSLEV